MKDFWTMCESGWKADDDLSDPPWRTCVSGWKAILPGTNGSALSAAGQEQAEQVGLYLQRKLPNARIVSSPLLRCRQTAGPAGLPYEICPELAEVDMGCWTGLPFDEIRLRWPELYERRGRDPLYISPPGRRDHEPVRNPCDSMPPATSGGKPERILSSLPTAVSTECYRRR